MLFPFWLFSSVFAVFPASTSEQKPGMIWPSITLFLGDTWFCSRPDALPRRHLCNSGPPCAVFHSECERFLFPLAGCEPEATSGNLQPLQRERGLQGRNAAGEGRSREKWEGWAITRPLGGRSDYSRRNSGCFYLRLIWIFLKCFTVSWGNYTSV